MRTYLEPEEILPLNLDFYDIYPTADGQLALYPIVSSFFAGLCRACGHPEWITDPRFSEVLEWRRNMPAFVALVAEALAQLPTAEALSRLREHDVAVAEALPAGRVADHPQVRHNGTIVERHDPTVGPVRVPRHAPRFGVTPAEPPGDVPALGQHTDEVLRWLGVDEREIETLRRAGVVGTSSRAAGVAVRGG